ncbi:MAG: hypothetical protein NZ602_05125 [Thermoguttaceae bacterium]|nr:hypothetical protein [Thermoguttaceae bacterium]MDW8039052.1 hypothetical protein [Thermoguttaceae bacterium]
MKGKLAVGALLVSMALVSQGLAVELLPGLRGLKRGPCCEPCGEPVKCAVPEPKACDAACEPCEVCCKPKHDLLAGLKQLFQKKCCCDSCGAAAPVCEPVKCVVPEPKACEPCEPVCCPVCRQRPLKNLLCKKCCCPPGEEKPSEPVCCPPCKEKLLCKLLGADCSAVCEPKPCEPKADGKETCEVTCPGCCKCRPQVVLKMLHALFGKKCCCPVEQCDVCGPAAPAAPTPAAPKAAEPAPLPKAPKPDAEAVLNPPRSILQTSRQMARY